MSNTEEQKNVVSYKFHHIDIDKCNVCKEYSCENVCFRGIYKVINKGSIPESIVVLDREDRCVKCHMCTTACKLHAILID